MTAAQFARLRRRRRHRQLRPVGFLFRLDAKKNDFKLQPDEGPAITDHHDDPLIPELRDAWSHRVVAEVTRTEHRYAYAHEPFRRVHTLRRIVRKTESAGGEQPPEA